jgi:hypothetical protein
VAGGLNAATTERAQIDSWWSRWADANVGIRTGVESRLVVIDVDPDHGGNASLERLTAEHGALPLGRAVRTGSDGRHLYFRHPGGLVRNDAGRRLGPGLDIRGDGGYVIAPPSRHRTGAFYVVAARGGEIPELPEWIEGLMRPGEPTRAPSVRPGRPTEDTTAWAKAAVEGELNRLRGAQPGMRNHTLNKVAFRLGQIIAGGQLDEREIEGLLVKTALGTGLGEREAVATVHSGLSAGEAVPRLPGREARAAPEALSEGAEIGPD